MVEINHQKSTSDVERKSVAVVYQGCYPDPAGLMAGARRVRDLAQGIAEANIQTWMLTPAHFVFGERSPQDRFEVVHLGNDQPIPTLASRMAFWRGVYRFATKKPIDSLLFYHTTIDSWSTLRHLRKSGRFVALEVCDLFSTMNWKPWKKAFYKLAEIQLPKQTNLNVAISSGIQGWLRSTAPRTPTMLVPGLFDCRDFKKDPTAGWAMRERFGIHKNASLFVYSGSWFKIKGIETLMRSFAALKRTNPECRLVITGRKTNERFDANIPALIDELQLHDSVIMTGFLDNAGMAAVLSGADVVVCPHDRHRFADFAFPTKIAEYAGMGCCIIATDVGDVRLYLKDGMDAMICPPQDIEAMASGMRTLCSNPELRCSMGINARLAAERHFDYRKNGKILASALLAQQIP